jgi:hypothetical protein
MATSGSEASRFEALDVRWAPPIARTGKSAQKCWTVTPDRSERRRRIPMCAAVVLALAGVARADEPPRVRVRATSRIELFAQRDEGDGGQPRIMVWGRLADELGAPIPRSRVVVSPTSSDARTGPAASACDQAGPPARSTETGYEIVTDEGGAFCMRVQVDGPVVTMRARFDGAAWHEASSAQASAKPARTAITLAFDPEPVVVAVDDQALSVGVRVLGVAPDERSDAEIRITDERGAVVGKAGLESDGLARIVIPKELIGAPGRGELRAELLVRGEPVGPSIACVTERRARVSLAFDPAGPEVGDDGVELRVAVRWARGEVPGGSVEALRAGVPIAAAPVASGAARLVLTGAEAGAPYVLTLRYRPDSPFFEPGPMVSSRIEPRPRTFWAARSLAALPALLLAWWALSRLRARAKTKVPAVAGRISRAGTLRVVRPTPGEGAWRGRILDAHERTPIAGAVVSIVVPGFPAADPAAAGHALPTLSQVESDADGQFALTLGKSPASARLIIEAPWHTGWQSALPPAGEVEIFIKSRRRALLDRLVRWARRNGAPGPPEPTPIEIARRWEGLPAPFEHPPARAEEVARWARAVERAAFGPARVGELAESEVNALEPERGPPGSRAGR